MKTNFNEKDNEDILKIHNEVVELYKAIHDVCNNYLSTDKAPLLSHNDKFLIVSRAINVHAKNWFEGFHDGFDAVKRMTEIEEKKKVNAEPS